MKYLAIEFMGTTEVTGYEYVCMNNNVEIGRDEYRDDSDSVRLSRQLMNSLADKGKYGLFEHGKLVIEKAFCVFDLELLQHMVSINRRIRMNLYNPLLLYCCGGEVPKMGVLTKSRGVDGIVDLVEKYYNR